MKWAFALFDTVIVKHCQVASCVYVHYMPNGSTYTSLLLSTLQANSGIVKGNLNKLITVSMLLSIEIETTGDWQPV